MKERKIAYILFFMGILLIIIPLTIVFLFNNKPNKENTKKKLLSTYIEEFKKTNYQASLVYYYDIPNEKTNHVLVQYNYKDNMEVYYDNDIYKYIDYKNKKQYEPYNNTYDTIPYLFPSYHNLIIELLESSRQKENKKNTYTLTVSKKQIKEFLSMLNEKETDTMKYDNNKKYEVKITITNDYISSLTIKVVNTKNDITFTFSNFNKINDITIPNL